MSDSTETDWDLIASYAGLLSLATLSVYTGSYAALTLRSEGRKGEEEEEPEEIPDRLSSQDAYLFPVIGSVVLFGLYLVVKYFGKEWINWLLQWYFTFAGVGSVSKSLVSVVRWTVGKNVWRRSDNVQLLCLKGRRELVSLSVRTPSLFLIPLGALPSIMYNFGPSTARKSALLTDMLALSFAHNAMALLKIDSFGTGIIMLSGLFLYDIWWVFGTEVMVKVATTLDVPIKILWPKSIVFSTERGFTMLGLGDIVVPGLFVALALRYDYHMAGTSADGTSFRKPYFCAALLAYVAGLVTTMVVMHVFGHAQPALLYLSPACILSFLITAFVKNDFRQALAWTDEPQNAAADAMRNGKADTQAGSPGPSDAQSVTEITQPRDAAGDNETLRKRKS